MTTSNRAHVYYGIGLFPIDFYILNRNDSKRLIECCLKESCVMKDFTHIADKYINIEEIMPEIPFIISKKNVFIHFNKRAPIVNMLDKGLMAIIEILKIDEE
jgi:hypothetical protein